ncbi:MAG: hypothetical protein ABL995_00655 [Bryobacteraceae bacterium]
MPRKTADKIGDSKEPHTHKTGSKKTKPSFALPAETDASESAAGWVYRESAVSALPADERYRDVSSENNSAAAPVDDASRSDVTQSDAREVSVTVVAHQYHGAFPAEPFTSAEAPDAGSNFILGAATEVMILGMASVGFAALAMMRLVDVSMAVGSQLVLGLRRSA